MTYAEVIGHFKTQTAVAAALGINQCSVSEWQGRDRIPSRRQLQLEVITERKLLADSKSDELRFPAAPRSRKTPQRVEG